MQKIVIVILFFGNLCFGQSKYNIDSLKQVSASIHNPDSARAKSYVALLRFYRNNNADSCVTYFEKFLEFSKKQNYDPAFYEYYRLKADYFSFFEESKGDAYPFINSHLLEALAYAKKLEDPKKVFIIYSRLTQENARLGRENEALEFAREAEKVARHHEMWEELAYILGQIGKVYNLGFRKTDIALEYLLKSDSIYHKINFEGYQRGFTLTFIGDVYEVFEDYEKAEKYQNEALMVFRTAKNQYQQNFIFGKLALLESKQGHYEKAKSYIKDAITYYQKNSFPIEESVFLVILSDLYLKSGDPSSALKTGDEAIAISQSANDEYGLMKAYVNQSKVYRANKEYKKSNELAVQAEALAQKMEFYEELKEIYELLYLNSENTGSFKEAYHYSNAFRRVNDTLVSRKNLHNAKELEAKYQTEKKE
ncbi:MAG: hypothetical protein R2781_07720 [Flavobacteriaceae bacterium]